MKRASLLWYSAVGAAVGAVLLVVARTVAATLLGAAVLGFAGTTLLGGSQAILSDRHGERRDRALTEANVGAAACGVLAPILGGLFQGTAVRLAVRPRAARPRPGLALPALPAPAAAGGAGRSGPCTGQAGLPRVAAATLVAAASRSSSA